MKIEYVPKEFGAKRTLMIAQANKIIDEYRGQGFDLTLRQLYYQFVARALLENSQRSYKNLGEAISDGRLAGAVDWSAIIDRTRNLEDNAHWTSPQSIIRASAESFRLDKWADQPNRVEVWIEKEALSGVLEAVCPDLDVDYFCCRGYVSQSEQWSAAMRLKRYIQGGQDAHVIHLGDHDPSGIDMTRDLGDRFGVFGARVKIHRIALNMDQVEEHNPPPNPAKTTDSRYQSYQDLYGDDSWELDALEPRMLIDLITQTVENLRDPDLWDEAVEEEEEQREVLEKIADNYEAVVEAVEEM